MAAIVQVASRAQVVRMAAAKPEVTDKVGKTHVVMQCSRVD
jgi:hypothetical protein